MQKTAQIIYQTDMKYSQKLAQEAIPKFEAAWKATHTELGCAKVGGPCGRADAFLSDPPRYLRYCQCSKLPVSITNAQGDVHCAQLTDGQYACTNY